jgi:MFS family permease
MSKAPNPDRLFKASCVALITTAMAFSIRGGIMSQLGIDFHLNATELGWVVGTAFWGFTLAMVIGGSLCDVIGMRMIFWLAFAGHISGIILTILSTGFWSLFLSTLCIGLANGLVEAAANPMVGALYPDNKTTKLNHFHAWFPGGLVIGGLVVYGMDQLHLGWQIKMATMLVPAIVYGIMFLGQSFPQSERAEHGISMGAMFKECLQPLFLFMMFCMCLTASTENGTNQFITFLLEKSGVPDPILVLVWVTGLMTVGRLFAGPVVHRLSPMGMLLFSATFSVFGLAWLARAQGAMAFVAAFFFAVGVCYFWPTMLGFVNERMPRTGAVGLALMGGAGMLAGSFALPIMGQIYDRALAASIAGGTPQASAQLAAGSEVLKDMTWLPAALVVLFAGLAWHQRGKGAVKIGH